MVCPSCTSTDLKKISLIHAAGVYESRGQIRGLMFGAADGFLLGKYRGKSQSHLSKSLDPPRKLPYAAPIVLWLVGLFPTMAFVSRAKLSLLAGSLSMAYILALPVYLLVALLYNGLVRPKKHKNWEGKFMCQRCGAPIEAHTETPANPQTDDSHERAGK
jgi:hypothetical protein